MTPGIRIVVFQRLRGFTPAIATAFINLATRLRPTRIVVLERSSAWMLGAPYTPRLAVVDLLDPLRQPRILERAIGRRAALPVMEAGAVHTEHATHHSDG